MSGHIVASEVHSLHESDGGELTVTVYTNGSIELFVEEATYENDEDGCGCSGGGWQATIWFSPDDPVDLTALCALKEIFANLKLPE